MEENTQGSHENITDGERKSMPNPHHDDNDGHHDDEEGGEYHSELESERHTPDELSRSASGAGSGSRPASAISRPISAALESEHDDNHLPSIQEKKSAPRGTIAQHGKLPPRTTVVHHPDIKGNRGTVIDNRRKQGTIVKGRKKTEVKKMVVEKIDVDMRRRDAKHDLHAKDEVKKVEEDDDDPNLDPIERILRKREKKISIEVPSAPLVGTRIRKVLLKEKDMFHLIHEVKGTKYGPPCRPEITLLTVGKGASSNPENSPSDFPGVEVLADFAKELFILSDRIEDKILTLCKVDPIRAGVITSALSACEEECTNYFDVSMSRCWKRFIINHIIPQLSNNIRMVILGARVQRFKDNEIAEFGSACPVPE